MTKSHAMVFAFFAAALCLAVQPAQAQKGGGGAGGGVSGGGGAASTLGNATPTSGDHPTNIPSDTQKPAAVVLQNNPMLNSKGQPLIPLGMTPQDAADGYKQI